MILIIESNSAVAQSLKKALKLFSDNILITTTFKNAIEIICNDNPDYIIATEEILNEYGQGDNVRNYLVKTGIPVVLLTANGIIKTVDLNIIKIYYKPFDPCEVYNSLVSYAKEARLQAI